MANAFDVKIPAGG